jgi:hypothetical protein
MPTSAKYPASGTDDGSIPGETWTSPGNITASDDSRATITYPGKGGSHYLVATDFGFAIPAGSTIDGIQVAWERHSSGGLIADQYVFSVQAGTITGNNLSAGASWTGGPPDAPAVFGGPTELWGLSWTHADINASTFGMAISPLGFPGVTAAVDSCQVTVFYTTPPGLPQKATVVSHAVHRASYY